MKKYQQHELNVLICYKNFAAHQGISHIGLGVSALNNVKALNKIGIRAQVMPLKSETDLMAALRQNPGTTHVVVQAPWISTQLFSSLCAQFPDTNFVAVSHSNVGFLQADRNGIRLIKEYIALEQGTYNFHVGGNSLKFCRWVENTFGEPCTHLPNMYFLHHCHGKQNRKWGDCGGTLRIGVFGATRGLKNILSAAGAAMEISTDLHAQTELWINTEREDGHESKRLISSVEEIVSGVPNITLKKLPWSSWSAFKNVLGSMHLLIQPSYTESFNMVSADGAAKGVPSVVSDAIDWAPKSWRAEVDDVNDIARVGAQLIGDPESANKGVEALKIHNRHSEHEWLDYLILNRFGQVL